MTVTIYHNPKCSKSRAVLELIRSKGAEPQIIEYLKTPPDAETLDRLLRDLDLEPRDLMRKKEAPYAGLGLDGTQLSRRALIQAMIDNPILIERPIVIADGKVRLGRPPENVLVIL